jgi:hypothetical protein
MVFGPTASALGVTTDDLTARYVAWMTLGGTQKHLPQPILAEVSDAPVLGTVRQHIALVGTPDMLRLGLSLCEQIVSADPSENVQYDVGNFVVTGTMNWSGLTGLIGTNGDAEMWLRLCNLNNRQIVRVATPGGPWTATTTVADLTIASYSLYWATTPTGQDLYGPNPVMDDRGNLQTGVSAANLFPICVAKPSNTQQLQWATQVLAAAPVRKLSPLPFCPDGFATDSNALAVDNSTGVVDYVDGRKWAARGAINAAMAVFLYLNGIESNPSQRQPLYTQCNLIGTTK